MSATEMPPPPQWGRNKNFPRSGDRIGPAWVWMWWWLWSNQRRFRLGKDLAAVAAPQFGIAHSTVMSVLSSAASAGVLETKMVTTTKPIRQARAYRVSPVWLANNTTESKES